MNIDYTAPKELIESLNAEAYKEALLKGYDSIYKTKPIVTGLNSVDLHVFVCEKHLLMAMWALKSFYVYADVNPHLFVHDDGSLSEGSIKILRENFVNIKIISKQKRDQKSSEFLEKYPYCAKVRNSNFYNEKFFDPFMYSVSDYAIALDTDILMFKRSDPLLDRIRNKLPFYVGGGYGFLKYIRDMNYIAQVLNIIPAGNVNAGFMGRPLDHFFDLDFLEDAIKKIIEAPEFFVCKGESIPTLDKRYNGSYEMYEFEQVLLSFLFGRDPRTKVIWANLPPTWAPEHCQNEFDLHQYPNTPLNRLTSICHYSYEFKHRFFSEGVAHLMKKGFMDMP